jgi:hypothetical protein
MEYSVIFSGAIHEDFSRRQVRQNLATLFRTDDADRLERLLSGAPVVLKKGLTEAEAARYQQTLLRAGAICELCPAAEPPPAPAVTSAAFLLEDPMLPAVRPAMAEAAPASTFASLSGLNLGVLDDALDEPGHLADPLAASRATTFAPVLPVASAPPALAALPPATPAKRDFSDVLAGMTLAPIEAHGEDSKGTAPPPRPAAPAAPSLTDFGATLAGISLVPIEEAPAAVVAAAPAIAVVAGTVGKLATAAPPPPPPGVATVEVPKSSANSLSPILREQLAADAAGIRSTFGAGSGEMPEEARGLCWAGFLLPWLWLRKHSAWYIFPLLIVLRFTYRLIPWPIWAVIYLGAIVFLLFKGREMAWRSRSWSSVEVFNQHQKLWTAAGVVLAVVQVFFLYNVMSRSAEASANPRITPETAAMREEVAREQAEAAAHTPSQGPDTGTSTVVDTSSVDGTAHDKLGVAREAYLSSFKDPAEREKRRKALDDAAARDAAQPGPGNVGESP